MVVKSVMVYLAWQVASTASCRLSAAMVNGCDAQIALLQDWVPPSGSVLSQAESVGCVRRRMLDAAVARRRWR